MKASVIFNANGTMTLLCGKDVEQFTTISSMLGFCDENGINITRTHTIQ